MHKCSPNARAIQLKEKVVIYNSLIGGAFVLSNNALPLMTIDEENGKVLAVHDDAPQQLVDTFERHALLCDGLRDEELLAKKLDDYYAKVDSGDLVANIRLTLTKACNCRCIYCFVDKNECTPPLSFEECVAFIDKVVAFRQMKEYNLRFFGGEPMLEFPVIRQIVEYLVEKYGEGRFSFLLNTNAQHITDEMRAFLKQHHFKTIISLDSNKVENDADRVSLTNKSYYDAAIEQIKKFVKDELHFVVGAVVTNNNYHGLPAFLETMYRLGVKSVGINHAKMVDTDVADLSEEFADKIVEAYRYGVEHGMHVSGYWFLPFNRLLHGAQIGFCGGLGHEFDLRPDRKVYTCVAAPVPIGSFSDECMDIIKSEAYLSIAKRVVPRISACSGCELEGMCAGDCAWDAYDQNKTIYSVKETVCRFQKYITRQLVNYVFGDDQ